MYVRSMLDVCHEATSAKKMRNICENQLIRVIRVHKCPDGEKAWKTQKIEWICEM